MDISRRCDNVYQNEKYSDENKLLRSKIIKYF